MLYDVFVSAHWFQAVSLCLPSVTYTDQSRSELTRSIFGLFIFGKVGKNFCIRCVNLGLMV